jgi:hypothetical protein
VVRHKFPRGRKTPTDGVRIRSAPSPQAPRMEQSVAVSRHRVRNMKGLSRFARMCGDASAPGSGGSPSIVNRARRTSRSSCTQGSRGELPSDVGRERREAARRGSLLAHLHGRAFGHVIAEVTEAGANGARLRPPLPPGARGQHQRQRRRGRGPLEASAGGTHCMSPAAWVASERSESAAPKAHATHAAASLGGPRREPEEAPARARAPQHKPSRPAARQVAAERNESGARGFQSAIAGSDGPPRGGRHGQRARWGGAVVHFGT